MSTSYTKTRIMVECALMIALGTILANIKIYELPNGGSITLFSMVPFILVSFRHGVKWGLFTGFVNSLLQMLLGFYAPPAPGLLPLVGMILLDYVLAFTFLGLACVFAKPFKNKLVGVAVGSAAVCVLRFLCSFLSGVLIWGNLSDGLPAWVYSLTYNGSYMLPEAILTTVAVVLLYKAAPPSCSAPITDFAIFNSVCLGFRFAVPQDFLFPLFSICPHPPHKSFALADTAFLPRPPAAPHVFCSCPSSYPFQLLIITKMRFCTVSTNVFLLSYSGKNTHFMSSLSVSLFR